MKKVAMIGLIQRLNKLAKLTPDEIANNLAGKLWVRGEDMTQAQYEAWHMQSVKVIKRRREGDSWFMLGTYHCTWGLRYIHRNLHSHYFKLVEHYEGPDDVPDR